MTKDAEGLGYAVGFGGMATGFLALLVLVVTAAGGLPWWPDWWRAGGDAYSYGYGLHALHWGSWLLCLWLIRLHRNRAYVLATLLVHLVALLVDVLVFVLLLVGLLSPLVAGATPAVSNLLGAFVSALFLVFASVTLPALLTFDRAAAPATRPKET